LTIVSYSAKIWRAARSTLVCRKSCKQKYS